MIVNLHTNKPSLVPFANQVRGAILTAVFPCLVSTTVPDGFDYELKKKKYGIVNSRGYKNNTKIRLLVK